jgi:hypothetical protein
MEESTGGVGPNELFPQRADVLIAESLTAWISKSLIAVKVLSFCDDVDVRKLIEQLPAQLICYWIGNNNVWKWLCHYISSLNTG